MRNDVCSKCGMADFYIKGNFAYCRVCHNEAQKRYLDNRRMGINYELKNPPPSKSLSELLKSKGSHQSNKTHCPRNHPYNEQNTRVTEQRPGVVQRKCRACQRDAKRVSYGLSPEPTSMKLSDLLDS